MKKKELKAECCECATVHKEQVERVKSVMPSDETLSDVADLFKVFGDSTRTKILSALFVGELCVCDISEILSMTKSAVSHQLRILRQAKLVKNRRSGKEIYYSLNDEHISKIYKMALEHLSE